MLPDVPRPPEAPPRPTRRLGRVAAAVIVAALAGAVLTVARVDTGGAPGPSPASPPTVVTTTTTVLVEVVDGVEVEYRRPADLDAAYHAVAPDDGVAAVGASTCARGAPEERAWSRPESPDQPAGRFRCAHVAGRAVMWWTIDDEGLLVHARAPDDDLAALFEWWRARSDT